MLEEQRQQCILPSNVVASSAVQQRKECSMKHTKDQSSTGLISTVKENCPASVATDQPPFSSGQININYIVESEIIGLLITDLDRVFHALYLYSPNMAAAAIVNQPRLRVK